MIPRISVIMNCRNGEPFLEQALGSVISQSMDEFEFISWDNLSTDRSPEIARDLDSRLRYFRGDKPLTLGEARNEAIEKSSGEFIAILDVDDFWLPMKLEEQLNYFYDPHVNLVYTNTARIDESGEIISIWTNERPIYRGCVFDRLLGDCFISMSTILVRREVLCRVGKFNPAYEMVEDWDLYLKLSEVGKFDYVPGKPLVMERQHAKQTSLSYDRVLDETVDLLEAWANKKPEFIKQCKRGIQLAGFKRQVVHAFLENRERSHGKAAMHLLHACRMFITNPLVITKGMFRFFNRDNLRFFLKKFSQKNDSVTSG